MKKLASLFLATALTAGMTVPAFAAVNPDVYMELSDVVFTETIKVNYYGDVQDIELNHVPSFGTILTVENDLWNDSDYLYSHTYEYVVETGRIWDVDREIIDATYANFDAANTNRFGSQTVIDNDDPADGNIYIHEVTHARTGANIWYTYDDTMVPVSPYTHVVVAGESLQSIALKYYGTADVAWFLYLVNTATFAETSGALLPGTVLVLPVLALDEDYAEHAIIYEIDMYPSEILYTVQAGDTLVSIAKAVYGDPAMYQALYVRNASSISNPNYIQPGLVLVLPWDPGMTYIPFG